MSNLALVKKDVVDVVSNKVREFTNTGELALPANYSPENAMKSAWLLLQETQDRNKKQALDVCTKDSVANALLDMVVQGLNPAKKQCYFIVYGNKLQLHRSYFGTMHVTKSVDSNIDDIVADVVYQDDEFAYSKLRGKTVITSHNQKLANVDKTKIIAAYCTVIYKDGKEDSTIMTMDEIKQAWKQSKMSPIDDKGNISASSTHGKFTAEMAKKTVINKACKRIINSSNDDNLIINAFQKSENLPTEERVENEISEKANQQVIDVAFEDDSISVDVDTGEVIELADGEDPF